MKRIFQCLTGLLLTATGVQQARAGSILSRRDTSLKGHIFYMGVGITQACFDGRGMGMDSAFVTPLFQSDLDVINLSRMSRDQWNARPEHISALMNPVHNSQLLDSIQKLIRSMGNEDIFIFHYSGISVPVETDTNTHAEEIRFYLSMEPGQTSEYFTLSDLKLWLDLMPARRQLIFLDAGKTEHLKEEMIARLTENNFEKALAENRNRIFLSNMGYGMETRGQGGALTLSLASVATQLGRTDFWNYMFDEESQPNNLPFLLQQKLDSMAHGSLLNYIREKDIFEILQNYLKHNAGEKGEEMRGDPVPLIKPGGLMDGLQKPKKYALVVGMNDYQYTTDLNNPIADAEALGKVLTEKYGYEAKLLRNSTSAGFMQALLYFLDTVQYHEHDQFLLYVAGHGNYYPRMKTGVIQFTDAKPLAQNPEMIHYQSYVNLVNLLNNLPIKNVLVVLDVCFGGTISVGTEQEQDVNACGDPEKAELLKSILNGNGQKQAAAQLNCANRYYLTSGGKEYVPDGTPGAHSPFSAQLIQCLNINTDPVLEISEIVKQVRKGINDYNAKYQKNVPVPNSGKFGVNSTQTEYVLYR
ncbi:MAG: caspase family protein [Bacteroidetes bacterium]|nr:caspase family protein [Bacteroidota bacterium]